MGNQLIKMKFTSVAVLALFLANSNAIKISGDDCVAKWGGKNGLCNHGLAYDHDEATLKKAEADNVAKTQHFNGATKAAAEAKAALGAATATQAAATEADAAAAKAKADTAGAFSLGNYKAGDFPAAEGAKNAAVWAKEAALDAKLKADDDQVAKTLISARKDRDLAASTAAKAASDANLKANQERFAYEKDQLERGENQDRLNFVNQATAAKTSEIQGKHDERERANGKLLKALASFCATID